MRALTKTVRSLAFPVVLFLSVLILSGCHAASGALSEEEIAVFNTEFFNGRTHNMNNMLLTSEYSKPEEIDLFPPENFYYKFF